MTADQEPAQEDELQQLQYVDDQYQTGKLNQGVIDNFTNNEKSEQGREARYASINHKLIGRCTPQYDQLKNKLKTLEQRKK